MKCYCCHKNFDDELSKCPCCGFPTFFLPDGTQISEADLESEISAFREEKVGNVEISIARYFWKKDEEKQVIVLDRKEYAKIADGTQLLKEGTVWMEQFFARTVSGRTISIEYKLAPDSETAKIPISTPRDVSFWQLGVTLDENMTFRFLLKSEAETKQSELIALI